MKYIIRCFLIGIITIVLFMLWLFGNLFVMLWDLDFKRAISVKDFCDTIVDFVKEEFKAGN